MSLLRMSLKQIFNNTNSGYAIDGLDHVFITKNTSLQTTLQMIFSRMIIKTVIAENDTSRNEMVKKEKLKLPLQKTSYTK